MRTHHLLLALALVGCRTTLGNPDIVDPNGDSDSDGIPAALDCNDADGATFPGAPEICDGIDNNCDGAIDEDDPANQFVYYEDTDDDGFGDPLSPVTDCTPPPGTVQDDTDCDDTDSAIYPNAVEDDCADPVDYNCDGSVGYTDADLDGFAACEECDDLDPLVNPDEQERPYNGVDDDCDAESIDDDLDGDGFLLEDDCDDTDAQINPDGVELVYDGVDNDCDELTPDDDLDFDGVDDAEDCDDSDSNAFPGNGETPYDGVDNDCDPLTLDDDLDGDGFGALDDCDDNDPSIHPDAAEVPYNDTDDDCDDATRDNDLDQDGVNADNDCNDLDPRVGPNAQEVPYNNVDDDCNLDTADDDLDGDGFGIATDCDDNNPSRSPGEDETPYNGIDDDCDDNTRDNDLDQDGFSSANDCDDNDPNRSPGITETPYNGIDDDCDENTRDDDLDNDGVIQLLDCDDNDPTRSPDLDENPYNGIDDDCDDNTPEDDLDNDGVIQLLDCDDNDPGRSPNLDEIWYDGIDQDCEGDDDFDQDGDGERSRTESDGMDCDDTNASLITCGQTADTPGESCLTLNNDYPALQDGQYWVNGGDITPVQVSCDMTFDGGGWTVIDQCDAQDTWGAQMAAIDAAGTEGIDANCRPYTRDGSGAHTYTYTFTFDPGFTEIAMRGWAIRANGSNSANTSDLGQFRQTAWNAASGGNYGDVSFGSATQTGPIDSFERNIPDTSCHNCTIAWPNSDRIYTVPQTSQFRLGWGEWGSQAEGWYPWWQGDVYLR